MATSAFDWYVLSGIRYRERIHDFPKARSNFRHNCSFSKLFLFVWTKMVMAIPKMLKATSVHVCKILLNHINLFWVGYTILIILYIFKINRSMLINTKDVSSNTAHVEVYSLQHYVIKFVSNLRQLCDFLRLLQLPPPIKLTATV
jgi:hypothetical protein